MTVAWGFSIKEEIITSIVEQEDAEDDARRRAAIDGQAHCDVEIKKFQHCASILNNLLRELEKNS